MKEKKCASTRKGACNHPSARADKVLDIAMLTELQAKIYLTLTRLRKKFETSKIARQDLYTLTLEKLTRIKNHSYPYSTSYTAKRGHIKPFPEKVKRAANVF